MIRVESRLPTAFALAIRALSMLETARSSGNAVPVGV
jgi:hypothetical protein